VGAAIWGAAMFLHFRKAPVCDQFICLVVLAGMAGFAVGAISASLRCFVDCINGLVSAPLTQSRLKQPLGARQMAGL
jgi:ABC-type uncharacterized transport system permease subunit